MKENQKLKQQTGIINNENLSLDYQYRQSEINKMQESILVLKGKHARLTELVKRADSVKMQQQQ
jgi:hypothetical protein